MYKRQGVYNSVKIRKTSAVNGLNSVFSAPVSPPSRTVRVETTLSVAVKPVINAVEMRQSPKPRGLKRGVIRLPTKARRLESGVAATFRRCV